MHSKVSSEALIVAHVYLNTFLEIKCYSQRFTLFLFDCETLGCAHVLACIVSPSYTPQCRAIYLDSH